ncbi:5'-nucleotidase C-terminal domain-containing protein [Alkalicoccobacillus porphyridii]|uniref:LysM peptidoglycan-binding domain-containing protein n=1 Tax=Alkalicoccobacillus porphyridii TaxID=2597270 RepID=A0A553ZW38_9BACI|nr:5'-nucleotidase C-terminal domain-containing protein [Alkalicoccobacillus porphyridii]TSB45643.1 LysM peptidoglycan-binding domain-containing protein [Alkalicoccobacillus porphyridii]
MGKTKLVVCTGLAGLFLLWGTDASAEEQTITILHTNDSHGRAFEGEFDGMGFAKLATLIEENRGEHSILLDAGDTFHGTTFASLEEGETIIQALNLMDYEALVPGNHDFNYGLDRLQELEGTADFPVLAANVLDQEGNPLFDPYMIKEFGGLSVGIFGLATPETAYKTHPDNVRDVEFEDPSIAAERVVNQLEEEGVDLIIALAHLGIDESSVDTSEKVAADVDGIDVIIDGHSHSELTTGLEADHDTLIASAGEYTQNLGIVELVVDDGELVDRSARLINMAEAEDTVPDAEMEALLDELEAAQQEILQEVIGEAAIELDGERENVRVRETNLGNLIADILLNATEADVALTNGGGIRASIAEGEVTVGDIVEVSPFGNFGVTKDVTGAELLEILENGAKAYPEPSGGFPQIAGFSFMIDDSKDSGERVHSVMIDGEPLDESATYTLATNDFLASGGDEYEVLADVPIVNEYNAMDELMITYFRDAGIVTSDVDGRIQVGTAEEAEEVAHSDNGTDMEQGVYEIQSGDTLFEIGLRYNVQWTHLMKLNPSIEDEDLIYVGDELHVPHKTVEK